MLLLNTTDCIAPPMSLDCITQNKNDVQNLDTDHVVCPTNIAYEKLTRYLLKPSNSKQ